MIREFDLNVAHLFHLECSSGHEMCELLIFLKDLLLKLPTGQLSYKQNIKQRFATQFSRQKYTCFASVENVQILWQIVKLNDKLFRIFIPKT